MALLDDLLNGESKPTVEDIASDLFTNDNGVPYTDLLAVGANPTAKIYRDGTVVGSTDNGEYIRRPNGELVMFGEAPVVYADASVLQVDVVTPIVYIGGAVVANRVANSESGRYERGASSSRLTAGIIRLRLEVTSGDVFIGGDSSTMQFQYEGKWK